MKAITIIVPAAFLLSACGGPGVDNIRYSNPPAAQQIVTSNTYSVNYGKIIDIREIVVEGNHDALGTYGGGLIGHQTGRVVGGGSGSRVAGAVAGVAGAIIGQAVQKKLTSETVVELTIQYDNGDVIAVVQAKDKEKPLALEEPVRVLVPKTGPSRVERVKESS
ncbi:MAG: hypothetical protein AAF438_07650 [Pseudomonadota bacterium]